MVRPRTGGGGEGRCGREVRSARSVDGRSATARPGTLRDFGRALGAPHSRRRNRGPQTVRQRGGGTPSCYPAHAPVTANHDPPPTDACLRAPIPAVAPGTTSTDARRRFVPRPRPAPHTAPRVAASNVSSAAVTASLARARPPRGASPGPTAPFKPSRTDALNREPAATPGATAPFKPSRTDPLNREPTATPGATAPFKPSRTDPLNREPTAKLGSTAPFKPSGTDALNREPAATPGATAPFKPFRTDPLNREPTARPGSAAPFKPSRTDPLNREPGAIPDPDQYIASMNPLISANPRDAPHTRSQRRRQGIFAADERR